jgi:hypothetical protein
MALSTQRLWFSGSLRDLGQELGDRLAPAVTERVRAGGIDFNHLDPAYPPEVFARSLQRINASIRGLSTSVKADVTLPTPNIAELRFGAIDGLGAFVLGILERVPAGFTLEHAGDTALVRVEMLEPT